MQLAKLLLVLLVVEVQSLTTKPNLTCSHDCSVPSDCSYSNSNPNPIYPICHEGLNLLCCPSNQTSGIRKVLQEVTSIFPPICGEHLPPNKIIGGKNADFGQFPFIAALGYKRKNHPAVEFLCGGSLITNQFVLTAAHCVEYHPTIKLDIVRLGEVNFNTDPDCKQTVTNKTICADQIVDVKAQKVLRHENYNSTTIKNDVGLVKLQRKVTFTDYIQPICLPFWQSEKYKSLEGLKLIVSGWGKLDSMDISGSDILQYATVKVWNQENCSRSISPALEGLGEFRFCANNKGKDTCKGDSGGPLIHVTTNSEGSVRYFQLGIVSVASIKTCGVEEVPPLYVNVNSYLKWIFDNVQ